MQQKWFGGLMAFLAATAGAAAQEARLLRFPTTQGDRIVFSYAGNLYSVPDQGGVARKLTSHDGYEMFARFSPDGKRLAFTGQYDGNTEVYVMPAQGGVPKRLTYTATLTRDEVSDRMGPNNIVIGWKDNEHIIFRSRMREPNDFIGQLYLVHVNGGLPQQIPLPRGGFCSYSADGKKLAYNRVFREFRTWKRYRGGMADDIWIHDFNSKKTEQITHTPDQEIIPMWAGNKVYFLSDRDDKKRMNLYSLDLATKGVRQHTHFADFDIKFPSLGDRAIVFEYAGYIYRHELASGQTAKVPILIHDDLATGRGGLRDVSKNIAAYEIAPDGKRALFAARGDLFTVPAKEGPTRHLQASSGVHERNPHWSPDGKSIAYISDATGEDEIHIIPQDGSAAAQQITKAGGPYKYALVWSPDSKKITWADKKMRLFYVDVATRQVKQAAQGKMWEIRDYAWSPDSKWIAYSRPDEETMPKIFLYSLEQDKSFAVTDGWHDSSRPAFSSDGKYLYFVSERDFAPVFSQTEWNHAYLDMARIYLVTLNKNTPSPFQPKSDEVAQGKDEGKPPAKKKGKEEKKDPKETKEPPVVKVDVEGLSQRILQLPVPPGNYRALTSVGSTLYYVFNSSKSGKAALKMFDLAAKKETEIGQVGGYEISANHQKMLVGKDGKYYIIDLPKGPLKLDDPLNLSGLQVDLDRHAEWRQIFHESWRQMRDFFYDPDMHGVDWLAIRRRYEPLLAHVNHRADLTAVIGDMIGELNAGHTYVSGGDLPTVRRIPLGLLGAELRHDPQTKYYQISKILKGANWDKRLRSPLTEIGVNVSEGDYILAVDGKPTNRLDNFYQAMVNTVDKQVTLTVNSKPQQQGSRKVTVVPIGNEQPLYYYNRVQHNIKKVSDATGGRVGYLHVPDMLASGLNEFGKHFYPQLRKHGLIIDVRGNGGGNVSPMLIERLRRQIAMIDMSRDTLPRTDPYDMIYGPKVCLMNEFSASDGDLFPYRFRHYQLGKLIGKRSWGGVIGIRGSLPLVDGGDLYKPEFASYDVAGQKWIIEGHGVDPDIVIDNDPAREFAGIDDQLNRAIEVILEELKAQPRRLPSLPPFPKR